MKDILKRLEGAAEQEFYEMTKNVPEGCFKCDCGKTAKLENAHPVANSPYAMPVCDDCFQDFIDSYSDDKQASKKTRDKVIL
jgi:hypothetical protein